MDAKTNGAQAAHPIDPQVEIDVAQGRWGSIGLTKRELFAAMAMQGLAANPGGPVQVNPMNGWGLTNCTFEHVAEFAVALADALLSQLSEAQAARVEGGAE